MKTHRIFVTSVMSKFKLICNISKLFSKEILTVHRAVIYDRIEPTLDQPNSDIIYIFSSWILILANFLFLLITLILVLHLTEFLILIVLFLFMIFSKGWCYCIDLVDQQNHLNSFALIERAYAGNVKLKVSIYAFDFAFWNFRALSLNQFFQLNLNYLFVFFIFDLLHTPIN